MNPISTDPSSSLRLFPTPAVTPSHPENDLDTTVRMLVPPSVASPPAAASPLARTAKVLHIVNGEHFSGAERVQSHLGRCLPMCGIEADFACVKPGRFAAMLEERGEQSRGDVSWGRCYRVPMRSRFDLRIAKTLGKIVTAEGYDLLHAHTPRTAMIASVVSRGTGVPWVYHVHSPASRDGHRMLSNRINAWIERRSLHRCSQLVCVSASLSEDILSQGFDPDRVSVVHNGVPAIRPGRDHVPVIGGRWTLGMIALMRNRKGLEVALEALRIVRRRGLDVRLRCIGPFETEVYRAKIDQQIDELEIGEFIQWVDFTPDVPSELARIDALILPSLFGEGLPMVVLEAMAAALPVIATKVEGTPEAVRHGIEGLLAEPRDARSLASEIESLVTGQYDWSKMAEAAANRHRDYFSDMAMAKATADVYRKVLVNRP